MAAEFVDGAVDQVAVEAGGGFVGEEQRGVADEGEGGGGALGEAAGEFVGVPVEVARGEGDAGGGGLGGGAQGVAAPGAGEAADGLGEVGADGADRGEVGGGALRDEADAAAAYGAGEGGLVGGDQVGGGVVGPGEQGGPGGLGVAGEQAEQGGGEDGLAAAALPDEGEALARGEVEGDVGDGADGALSRIRNRTVRPRTDRTVTASAPIGAGG